MKLNIYVYCISLFLCFGVMLFFFLFFGCFILRNKMYFGVVLIDILLFYYIFLFSLYIYGMIYMKYRKIKIKL